MALATREQLDSFTNLEDVMIFVGRHEPQLTSFMTLLDPQLSDPVRTLAYMFEQDVTVLLSSWKIQDPTFAGALSQEEAPPAGVPPTPGQLTKGGDGSKDLQTLFMQR